MQWPHEKRETTIYKALHRKLKIELHESNLKPVVNSGTLEGLAVNIISQCISCMFACFWNQKA